MHIQLEPGDLFAIQAYDDEMLQINSVIYESSLIVSREEIIPNLSIKKIEEMNEQYLDLLLKSNPELIIIGHKQPGVYPPLSCLNRLTSLQIGIECMSVGAACRTYNVLLSELRSVVAGFII